VTGGRSLRVVEVPRAWEPRGPSRFTVRALTGTDELACPAPEGASPLAVARLLDAVVEPLDGGPVTPSSTWTTLRVALPTRDRLLAELYRLTMGTAVEQHRACTGCGTPLEAGFDLEVLLRACSPVLDGVRLDEDGYLHRDGIAVRVPRCEDLAACDVATELAARCVQGPLTDTALAQAGAVLERFAPLLDTDLDATCTDCGSTTPWRFEIADHVFRALQRERPVLLREIDLLARTYAWSLDDVLRLARPDRHELVALATSGSRRAS
jgi:hypothetical protein